MPREVPGSEVPGRLMTRRLSRSARCRFLQRPSLAQAGVTRRAEARTARLGQRPRPPGGGTRRRCSPQSLTAFRARPTSRPRRRGSRASRPRRPSTRRLGRPRSRPRLRAPPSARRRRTPSPPTSRRVQDRRTCTAVREPLRDGSKLFRQSRFPPTRKPYDWTSPPRTRPSRRAA